MVTDDYKQLCSMLLETFSKDEIINRGEALFNFAEDFLNKRGLTDKVHLSEETLAYCLIDMLVDIARLRYFHDISNISKIKFNAYAASWWLRRKPFQRIDQSADLWVNERFALTLLLYALDNRLTDTTVYSEEKAMLAAKQAFYHLKYRNTNPQTLELFLIGLNATN